VPAAVSGVFVLFLLERATGRDFDDLLITVLSAALCSPALGRSCAHS
jgi:hypothetical protein